MTDRRSFDEMAIADRDLDREKKIADQSCLGKMVHQNRLISQIFQFCAFYIDFPRLNAPVSESKIIFLKRQKIGYYDHLALIFCVRIFKGKTKLGNF